MQQPTRQGPQTHPGHEAEQRRKDREEEEREREQAEQDEKDRQRQAEKQRRLREIWRRLLQDRRRTYTPFLVLPFKLVNPITPGQTPDLGLVRPISGEPFYLSPYILVESSLGLTYTAVADEPNFVHARIFNFGKAPAAPTQVDFYWADPSLGLGPGTFNLIGTRWVELPAKGKSLDVRCNDPWVPTFLNEGHECLLVQCSNPKIVYGPNPPPGPFDPITAPFNPVADRHVGQRNLTVIKAKPAANVSFHLNANNVFPFIARVLVTAQIQRVLLNQRVRDHYPYEVIVSEVVAFATGKRNRAQAAGSLYPKDSDELEALARTDAGRAGVGATDVPLLSPMRQRGAPAIASQLLGISRILNVEAARSFAAQLLQSAEKFPWPASPDQGQDIVLHELTMKPAEQRRLELELTVPGDSRPDEFIVFHLRQWSEGMVIGGYAVVVEVI